MHAQVSAGMARDEKFKCFRVLPTHVIVGAGETTALRVFAFPQETSVVTDELIVCVKDNPTTTTVAVSVEGVKPEIELTENTIAFDRVLTRRKITSFLTLVNKSKLPVSWSLARAVDILGDDFEIPQVRVQWRI